MSSPKSTVKLVSPFFEAMRDSRMFLEVTSRLSVFSARMLICWIWRELSILFRAAAETKIAESRSRLLKLIGSSTSERTPTIIKRSPRRVTVFPIGSPVPKRSPASLAPITAVGVEVSSFRKVPDFRLRF